jgi:hypothetical protein
LRVAQGLYGRDKVAMHTADRKPSFLQSLQVSAARDERDIRAMASQQTAKIAAKSTCTHHDNTHKRKSLLWRETMGEVRNVR